MTDAVQTLELACEHLEAGRHEAVLAALAEGAEAVVAQCCLLCAKGALLERAGDFSAADACFQQVFVARPPVPAILRACGRYLKRRGEFDKSFTCFATLAGISPEALDEFLRDLPGPELCRFAPLLMRRFTSGPNPSFYGMQPVKEALARNLDEAVGAAHAFAHLSGAAPGCRVRSVRLRGLEDYAREAAQRYEEHSPRKPVHLPPVRVFAGIGPPGFDAQARSFFSAVIADAVVTSKSNLVLVGGEALLDVQGDELDKVPLDLDVDPLVVCADGDRIDVSVRDPAASRGTIAEALSLTGVHSHDFGHWMIEFLPKVWACLEHPEFAGVPIVVDDAMPVQHIEALRLFAGPDRPLLVLGRGESVHVERLWAPSMIVYMPLGPKPGAECARDLLALDAAYFAALISRVSARLPASDRPESSRRIYLTRKDSQHRRLVNRPEIEGWLAARGFDIVDLEKLSFRDRITRIRAADVILGASGSSFFVCFFARRGTLVGELSHEFLEDFEWYSAICGALGLQYWVIGGRVHREHAGYRTFSEYRVETETLSRFLQAQGHGAGVAETQRILAFVGVKDEAELIEGAIANLRAIDVDAIAVADLGSTDGTLEILRSLEKQGVIALVEYDENDDKFSSMDAPQFQSLLERFKPDWIMLSDADERWITERGSIRHTIAHHDADILVVNRCNVPLTAATARQANDIGVRDDFDFDLAMDGPLVSEELFIRDPGCRWSLAVDAPRVMFRADAARSFDAGQHAVMPSRVRDLSVKIASDVFVAHLPITSETRFAAKLGNVSRYLKRRVGRADQGRPWHWRRWAEIHDNGLTRGEYLAQFVSDQDLDEAYATGACVRRSAAFAGSVLARAPLANRYLGLHWERLGRFDQAVGAFRQALRAKPGEAQFHIDLARALAKQGRREDAVSEAREALRLAPSNPEAHDILRQVHQGAGELGLAIEHAREAVRSAPDTAHYRYLLAAVLEVSGALDEAKDALAAAIACAPAEAAGYTKLSNLLLRQGQPEEALECARKAILGAGASVAERRLLSTLLERRGRLDEALAAAREAAQVEPQAPEHHNFLAHMLLRAKALDEALTVVRSATDRWPKHANLRRAHGEVLRRRGDREGAIAQVREAVAFEPNNGDHHVQLGFLLFQAQNFAEARPSLERGLALASRHVFGRRMLSGALWQAGERAAALAEARRAVELQPKGPEPNAHLGFLLLETGAIDEAETVLRLALEIDPEHVYARRSWDRLQGRRNKPEAVAAAQGAASGP